MEWREEVGGCTGWLLCRRPPHQCLQRSLTSPAPLGVLVRIHPQPRDPSIINIRVSLPFLLSGAQEAQSSQRALSGILPSVLRRFKEVSCIGSRPCREQVLEDIGGGSGSAGGGGGLDKVLGGKGCVLVDWREEHEQSCQRRLPILCAILNLILQLSSKDIGHRYTQTQTQTDRQIYTDIDTK